MRRALLVLPLACLVAFTGCIDAMLDGTEPPEANPFEPQESVAGNETNETNGTGGDDVVIVTPVVEPTPTATTAPTPTTTAPVVEPTPTTVAPTPPPPVEQPPAPTPPSPTPTPPPPTPTPPPPTPTTTPTPPPPSWPSEGSYVRYRVMVLEGSPDGSYNARTYANASWMFTNGDWRGTCDGTRYEQYRDQPETATPIHRDFVASSPPHWPVFNTQSPPAVGGEVDAWFLKGCFIQELERRYVGTDTEATTVNGAPRTANTYAAEDWDDGSPDDFRTEWSRAEGLVLYWSWSQRHTFTRGDLVDTNAPL